MILPFKKRCVGTMVGVRGQFDIFQGTERLAYSYAMALNDYHIYLLQF